MKKRLTAIIVPLILCFLTVLTLAGCGAAGQEKEYARTAPDGRPKIQVITTIFPPYDFVRQIGGDYVEADMLLKPCLLYTSVWRSIPNTAVRALHPH